MSCFAFLAFLQTKSTKSTKQTNPEAQFMVILITGGAEFIANNYGPYQFPEKLIPFMILNAFEGRPLPVYGSGENVREWLHVRDHCSALSFLIDYGDVGGDQYKLIN